MSLLDEFKALDPEEQAAFATAMKELQQNQESKQEPEVRQLGECMHGPGWDPRTGRYKNDGLTPEEIFDKDHPLNLRQYGYSETFASLGKPQETKYWSKAEVDAYNENLKRCWLEEKREFFPDATLPDLDE